MLLKINLSPEYLLGPENNGIIMRKYANATAIALCSALSTISYAGWYADLSLGVGDVQIQKKLTYNLTQADFTSAYRGFQGQLGLGYDLAMKQSWRLAFGD